MKKLFFTALVAIVAIGGAVAGSGKSAITAGPFNSTNCTYIVSCNPGGLIPCRIDDLDPTSPQLYLIDNQQPVGKCTVYLGYDD